MCSSSPSGRAEAEKGKEHTPQARKERTASTGRLYLGETRWLASAIVHAVSGAVRGRFSDGEVAQQGALGEISAVPRSGTLVEAVGEAATARPNSLLLGTCSQNMAVAQRRSLQRFAVIRAIL